MAAFINSIDQFVHNGDLRTANTSAAKPKRVKTTYPQDGQATWTNPGQQQFQLADQPDVRQFFLQKFSQYNLSGPGAQQDLWTQGQHINLAKNVGTPITKVIQQQDNTFKAEAQKNNQALQVMDGLRQQLNQSNFANFGQQANNGLIQTIQPMLSQIQGLFQQFMQMGSAQSSYNQNQNTALANNQIYGQNANGQPIAANGAVINATAFAVSNGFSGVMISNTIMSLTS